MTSGTDTRLLIPVAIDLTSQTADSLHHLPVLYRRHRDIVYISTVVEISTVVDCDDGEFVTRAMFVAKGATSGAVAGGLNKREVAFEMHVPSAGCGFGRRGQSVVNGLGRCSVTSQAEPQPFRRHLRVLGYSIGRFQPRACFILEPHPSFSLPTTVTITAAAHESLNYH
jgi:hypothetical protein